MNAQSSKKENRFKRTFSSMWETAKLRGITRKDAAEEIKKYRKESY